MANIHVLTAEDPDTTVVFHIAVPVGNNSAGIPWNTALVNSKIGGTTSLIDGDGTAGTISTVEKASIVAGNIYEYVASMRVDSNALNGAQLTAFLTAQFTALQPVILAGLQKRLKWFGGTAG